MKAIIALDVGGTSVKCSLVSIYGKLLTKLEIRKINSSGSKEEILDSFIKIIDELFCEAKRSGYAPAGIAGGFPGPFDYEKGISLISGVGKYEAIYGINLKTVIKERMKLPRNFPIVFEADSWAFLHGEYWTGTARNFSRVVGITLGTGLGSAFMIDGEIVQNKFGIPEYSWIGNVSYGRGILDDRVSRRGIIARYRELSKNRYEKIDVIDIASMAKRGDVTALGVFRETGEILGKALSAFLSSFKAELIVLGGGISKSSELIIPSLKNMLAEYGLFPMIRRAKNIESSAVIGAALYLVKKMGGEI
ncbi:hypothetical protein AT15_05565 [Kosmotoga arenicorallina S304]|uniref:ROK family transcriptional regulator n=1 Tax=Kosmotoga arenicorallina S304 TaxID=1453497 RepID=A0A176K377_9BACT|nr:ROK family protein [Kosmotoga arenicorallina]OAA31542.1 hypothetical protein AT15_05565 [Kosmotoga arenicorallina S304]